MTAGGLRGDRQFSGDLCVRQPLRDESRHGELAGRQRAPWLVGGDVTARHPLQRIRPIRERPTVQSGRHRAGVPGQRDRIGEPVRAGKAVRQVEARPGRLPDPSPLVPSVDRGLQRLARHTGRARSESDQTLAVIECRSRHGRHRREVLGTGREPGLSLRGPSGRLLGADSGDDERYQEGTLTDRSCPLQGVVAALGGPVGSVGEKGGLGEPPERREDQVDGAALLPNRQRGG